MHLGPTLLILYLEVSWVHISFPHVAAFQIFKDSCCVSSVDMANSLVSVFNVLILSRQVFANVLSKDKLPNRPYAATVAHPSRRCLDS